MGEDLYHYGHHLSSLSANDRILLTLKKIEASAVSRQGVAVPLQIPMLAANLATRTCRRKLKASIFALTPASLFHSLEAASSPLLDIAQIHIKGFSDTYDPFLGRAIHGFMVRTLIVHDIIHFNSLVNMYARFGDLDATRCVVSLMKCLRRGVRWFRCMLSGVCSLKQLGSFGKCEGMGCRPMDSWSLASFLVAPVPGQ